LMLGAGVYVLSQHGSQIAAWFSGMFGGGDGGGGVQTPPDEDSGTIFGTLAGILESLGSIDMSGIFDGLFDGNVTIDVNGIPDSIITPPDIPTIPTIDPPDVPLTEPWSLFDVQLPEWLGGVPIGGAMLGVTPGVLAQILAPWYVGTSDKVSEVLHDINTAIPGDNTGLEKGGGVAFSESGPFMFNEDGSCYDMSGKPLETCPKVTGVEKDSLENYQEMRRRIAA